MFDTTIRTLIDPALNPAGRVLAKNGVPANVVTWLGFVLGIFAAVAIVYHYYIVGLVFILISRVCDGLDGSVARAGSGKKSGTDLGGFLDIVLDFAFYGMIPFAFILADPAQNALAGGFLLLVFYINGASFLTYALMSEKRGLEADARGSKSILYTIGLAEATETILAFAIFCLFPQWFSIVAYAFAAIVVITTASRFALAYRNFR